MSSTLEATKPRATSTRRPAATSLFARLGGKPAIEATVDELYRRVLADDLLGRYFKAKDMPQLRQMQVDFFTQALGGGKVYKGKPLREAHAKLRLTAEHFGRVAEHLSDTLLHLGIAEPLVAEVIGAVSLLGDEVIAPAAGPASTGGDILMGQLAGLRAIVDSLQTNVFVANTDLHIVHINKCGRETLHTIAKPIEDAFGVRIEDILNGHIHRFHRDPKRVEHILRSPGYLPHSADFTFGSTTLRTRINGVYDAQQQVIGYTVCWDDVTAELLQKDQVQRLTNMVEQMPTNVFLCNMDLTITYMNPAARKTMLLLEPYLNVKADAMVGTSIDVFHKHPEHQRRMLADSKNLPHRALITVGPEKLDLLVSAIVDAKGEYVGPMLTWEIVTAKAHLEERIRETVLVVASSSEQLIQASAQMTSSSQETSAQATQVASAAEEINRSVQAVSSGIEEMGTSIKEIAKNATDAARVADEAVRIAEGTNTTIGCLGLSSAEIGKVIKVINGIAQQTNLLALNATIEAARAGDAGRGFAVVANEVKELARETARATEDIGQKIEAIQGGVKGAVDGIARISEVIHHISQVQGSIASAVEEQTVTSNEISRRVFEAARGTEDIARSVTSVAGAARGASDGATSTRSAAGELARMAAELQSLTDKKN